MTTRETLLSRVKKTTDNYRHLQSLRSYEICDLSSKRQQAMNDMFAAIDDLEAYDAQADFERAQAISY